MAFIRGYKENGIERNGVMRMIGITNKGDKEMRGGGDDMCDNVARGRRRGAGGNRVIGQGS